MAGVGVSRWTGSRGYFGCGDERYCIERVCIPPGRVGLRATRYRRRVRSWRSGVLWSGGQSLVAMFVSE